MCCAHVNNCYHTNASWRYVLLLTYLLESFLVHVDGRITLALRLEARGGGDRLGDLLGDVGHEGGGSHGD